MRNSPASSPTAQLGALDTRRLHGGQRRTLPTARRVASVGVWVILLSVLSACARQASPEVAPRSHVAILSHTILRRDTNALRGCGNEFPRGTVASWTPGELSVAGMFEVLRDTLLARSSAGSNHDEIAAFRVQAFGVTSEGARLIAAIGSRHELTLARGTMKAFPWRLAPLFVCDAGAGQFFALYDTTSKTVVRLTAGRPF